MVLLRRKFIAFGLVILALAATAPIEQAHAQQRCRDIGSQTRPIANALVRQIATPDGPFRFREASWSRKCGDRPAAKQHEGLMDETGRKVLVPAAYWSVVPISKTTALVRRSVADPSHYYYDYGVGERGPSPYFRAELGGPGDNVLTMPLAWSSDNATTQRTLYFWIGGKEPIATPRSESFNIVALKDDEGSVTGHVYVHNFRTAQGQAVSRIYSPSMEPISPVIGRVQNWRIVSQEDPYPQGVDKSPYDLVSLSMQFRHPDLPAEGLFMPVDDDGAPMAMPQGAVGVIPIRVSALPFDGYSNNKAVGWIVVFGAPDGFELVPGFGTLKQAMEQAATAPRYTGLNRFYVPSGGASPTPMLDTSFVKDQSGWRAVNSISLKPVSVLPPDQYFEDPEVGYEVVRAAYREATRLQQADEAARNAARAEINRKVTEAKVAQEARLREAGKREWERVLAGQQDVCSPFIRPQYLPVEGMRRYVGACNVRPGLASELQAQGAPQEVLQAARRRAEQTAAAARIQGSAPGPSPAAQGDPWARGLAAAQAAADSSYNSFLQQQNTVYQRNMEAWRSGAQNWRYERR